MNVSYYQCWKLILLTERAGHRLTSSELATIHSVSSSTIFPHRVTHAILIANNFLGKKISRFCENRNNKFPENLSKRVKLKNNETIKGATKLWLCSHFVCRTETIRIFLLRIHFVSILLWCHATQIETIPFRSKKWIEAISECFLKSEHERKQGSRESKSFPIKFLYLFLYN